MTPCELRAAVEAASAALRPDGAAAAGTAPTLERPKRDGFGDYSTNAAMLLAPGVGAPPREVAERLGGGAGAAAGRAARARRGRRARASSTCSWPTPGTRRRWRTCSQRATRSGPAARGAPERILVEFVSRQPDRPARRRRAVATRPTATRWRGSWSSHGHEVAARVLRQRRRLAGAQARRVDAGARARRGRCPRAATRATT